MKDFNTDPYYDDFESPSGARLNDYTRILFKPGYAVQARELTQMQSILQNQIKEFGHSIYQDGTPIRGGELYLNTDVVSVNIASTYNGQSIIISEFNNQVISSTSSNAAAKVLATDSSHTYPVLMVKYLRGIDFNAGETIQIAANTTVQASIVSGSSFGTGTTVSINEGVFYVDGFFAYCSPQTIALDPFSTTPTAKVGLEIQENIITYSSDPALLDPAQSSFNYQAPGADRYQYKLVLSSRTIDSPDQSSFFELLRIENGLITKRIEYGVRSLFEKTLARRTYDQAGDYSVSPFRVTASANTTDSTTFNLSIEPGKAYIKGYEFTTNETTVIAANKARTTNTATDYSFTPYFGNYVTVRNMSGGSSGSALLSSTSYTALDLHCVSSTQINTFNQIAYSNTVIGTAKVRNISGNINGAGIYDVYLTDVNVNSVIVNPASTSSNGSSIVFPLTFSIYDDAYKNVFVTIASGPGSYDAFKRQIVSYNGATRTAFVNKPFDSLLTASSNVVLNFQIKDVDSLVQNPGATTGNVYSTQNVQSSLFASMDVDPSSRTIANNTYLQDTNYNSLIFNLPQTYIAQGVTNVSHYIRKVYENQTIGTGNVITVTSGSNESVYYGIAGSQLSMSDVNNNVLVIPRTLNANGGYPATPTVTRLNDSRTLKINVASSGLAVGQTADVIINLQVVPTLSSGIASKALTGNSSITSLRVSDTHTNGTAVTGTTNASTVWLDTGTSESRAFIWYTSYPDIIKTPGQKMSLYLPDVFNIVKIYDSGTPNHEPNTTNAIDITNNYYLDDGQNDSYYNHSSIVLKPGSNPPSGQTVVMLQYFEHSGTGFFTSDSYPSASYSNNQISVYNSKLKGGIFLRDCVDFRPTRTKGQTTFALNSLVRPEPDLPMSLTYSYYLPRIDKLVATQDKEFKILTGTPSYQPQTPSDSDNAMTLYNIYVPAYTADVSDIKLSYVEHKRYTMKDIGTLDKRIQQLEYYSTLSALENQTQAQTILYGDGSGAKPSYGIIVDNFNGFDISDNGSIDLICKISNNTLSPYMQTEHYNLKFVSNSAPISINETTGKQNKKTHTLPYTEVTCVSQNTATTTTGVNPYLFGRFQGTVALSPSTDTWFSKYIRPYVISPFNDLYGPYFPPINAPYIPWAGVWTYPYYTWNAWRYWLNDYFVGFYGLDYAGYGFIDPGYYCGVMSTPTSTPVSATSSSSGSSAVTGISARGGVFNANFGPKLQSF